MTDKKDQIRNAWIYMLPIGVNSIIPLITIPIFTRIFTPAEYGVLGLCMIFSMFACGLCNFGILTAFGRNYFQYRQDKNKLAKLLYSSLSFTFINFLILLITTIVFKDYISNFLVGSQYYGRLIVVCFMSQYFANISNRFFFAILVNTEKANVHTIYKLIESILSLLISIYLVLFLKIGIIGIVISALVVNVLLFIILLITTLKQLPVSFDLPILKESLLFGLPLTPRIFFGLLNTQFDKYMISLLSTMGVVGIYHIGKQISEKSFAFMSAVQYVYRPKVQKMMFDQDEQTSSISIGKYITPFLYISTFMPLILALFSEELMILLTPHSYHGAIPIITILAMFYGSMFFGKIPQLSYKKKTYVMTALFILNIGLNVVLNIPLIIYYGAVGASFATMIAGLISGIIGLVVSQHYYKIYYEWNKIAWIMGTFMIASLIIAIIHLMKLPYIVSFSIKIIAMVIYLNLGIRYNIISQENFNELKSSLRLNS